MFAWLPSEGWFAQYLAAKKVLQSDLVCSFFRVLRSVPEDKCSVRGTTWLNELEYVFLYVW